MVHLFIYYLPKFTATEAHPAHIMKSSYLPTSLPKVDCEKLSRMKVQGRRRPGEGGPVPSTIIIIMKNDILRMNSLGAGYGWLLENNGDRMEMIDMIY